MTADSSLPASPGATGAVALSHWSVIRARGADAATFLQGQLTSDVAGLDAGSARLAGYCSPKGRLLASFIVWRPAPEEFLLACSADLLAATLKRLRMFVLRAKCSLSDAGAEVALAGIACADANADVAARALGEAAARAAVWDRVGNGARAAAGADEGAASLIRLPDAAGGRRWLAAASAPAGGSSLSFLDAALLPPLPPAAWHWLEVASGVPFIEAATADLFVPQMVNYELLGGVDFRKGCYPGQEVVARSQYRGTLKRRSLLFELGAPASAGQEVFHSADPGQPAGQVVNAAAAPELPGRGTTALALVEVKCAALEGGTLHLASPDGPLLRPAAMPYEVPLHAVDPA